jgi:hypothetical protein
MPNENINRRNQMIPQPINSTVPYIGFSAVTVADSVAETSILPIDSNALGSKTFQANYLQRGKLIRILICGIHSSAGNPTIRIRIKLNSTTILDTGVVSSNNGTNSFCEVRGYITCYSEGVSGTVRSQGFYLEGGGGQNHFEMVNTSATTINTTVEQTIECTVQWGTASASNSITSTNAYVETIFI